MAKVVVKSKAKKVKRKFPVVVKAPESFKSVVLGNSQVADLGAFVGKKVKINLMYVTGSMKNQNVRLVFRVVDVDSGVAKTEVLSYQQVPYFLNRFVKSGSDLVEDSFVCESKDGKKLRIKPFIITKKNCSVMVASSIREKVREIISKEVASKKAEEFLVSVVESKVQVGFRNEVKKIFPLKAFEFEKVIIE